MIEDNNKNKIDAGYTILSLACIEIWCRNFLDQKFFINKKITFIMDILYKIANYFYNLSIQIYFKYLMN